MQFRSEGHGQDVGFRMMENRFAREPDRGKIGEPISSIWDLSEQAGQDQFEMFEATAVLVTGGAGFM
jgi:hypothetical protein